MIFFFWFFGNLSYAGLSILQMRKLRTRVGEQRVQSHTGKPGGLHSLELFLGSSASQGHPHLFLPQPVLSDDKGPGALPIPTPQKAELLTHHHPFLSCLSANPQPQAGWKL